MDFGLMGIDGFAEPNKCSNGSGPKPTKHEKSDQFDDDDDDDNRVFDCKMPKISDELGLRSDNINNSFPKQQMLSFSNNNNNNNTKDEVDKKGQNGPNLTFSCYQNSSYPRNLPGLGGGNMNGGVHGSFIGIRGPFTPAQWIELEHQAMIYKYFTANVPVPANLLLPIRKALTSSVFPGFSLGSYSPHSYGWGSFHLGFSGSTDPESGRCRRTDGKKWRCSRDAVPDQKYCERHINRGRHRSRKPVEGHTGQAASGPTSVNAKGVPPLPAAMSSLVTSHGSGSNGVNIAQHQTAGATIVSGDSVLDRLQHHDQHGLSVMPPPLSWQSKESTSSVPKQLVSLGDSLHVEFGLVPNDSLLNPSEKSPYIGYKSNNSLLDLSAEQNQDQYPLRHFMDKHSNRSAISWADEAKSDWMQLSMSGPMSLGLSPNQDKMSVSPLRLSNVVEQSKVPFGWGSNTMGGPLGEVINNASNVVGSCKGTGSPQLGASPTGVLHKSTFVSLSNSSSGGSPEGTVRWQLKGLVSDKLLPLQLEDLGR